LSLRVTIGPALIAGKGMAAPDTGANYARACELAEMLGDTKERFAALWGDWLYKNGKGQLIEAARRSEDLVMLSRKLGDDGYALQALHSRWTNFFFLGDVNVFHGRISQDETPREETARELPPGTDSSGEHEVTFVRPHDLELSPTRTTTAQLEATVRFVIAAGSRVRLELVSKDSPQTIEVELTKERYRELQLRQGDVVFVHPKQQQIFRMPGPSSV